MVESQKSTQVAQALSGAGSESDKCPCCRKGNMGPVLSLCDECYSIAAKLMTCPHQLTGGKKDA